MAQSKRKCAPPATSTASKYSGVIEKSQCSPNSSYIKQRSYPTQSPDKHLPSNRPISPVSIRTKGMKRKNVYIEANDYNNLRLRSVSGTLHPGAHATPMTYHIPLHIPPHLANHHLPMTPGMCLGPKLMWSPHPIGMINSPHHIVSPLNIFAHSEGQCVPLRSPLPTPHPVRFHSPHHIPPHSSTNYQSPMSTGPISSGTNHNIETTAICTDYCRSPGTSTSVIPSNQKCVPLQPPIPSKFQGDIDTVKNFPVPDFMNLVNFPMHMSLKQSANIPEGMRYCVMCKVACPCLVGTKGKKSSSGRDSDSGSTDRSGSDQADQNSNKSNGSAIIPTQNKGVCTVCDVKVWVVVLSGLEIKWCKGCKNFRPWAAFGDKGLATKCVRCRDRQREKYALQKEEKDKTAVATKLLSLFG
jgi:hypothetical protein